MKKITSVSIASIIAVFGLFYVFPAWVMAEDTSSTIPPISGSIGDEGVTIPPISGSIGDEGVTIPPISGSIGDEDGSGIDKVPPVISAVSNITATTTDSNTGSMTVDYVVPTAFDAADGTATSVSCDPASGSFNVGTIVVTCTATDKSKNTATVTFTVTVNYGPVAPRVVTSPSTGGGGSYSSSGSGGGFVPLALKTTLATTTTSCPLITSYMQFGANNNGTQVALLQAFLKNSQGFDVNVTGIFDAQTLAAVRAFQTKYLADTMGPWGANQSSGYVYITTTKKINEIACNSPLTLSAADMVIINAYKNAQTGGTVGTNNGGVGPAVPALNASTTPLAPQVGVNTTGGNANTAAVGNTANTASVVNASVLQRMWSWIKGLFGH